MRRPPEGERRLSLDTIAAIALVVLGVIFVVENTRRTKIRFIIPEVRVQVWVALVAALAVGVVLGWLLERRRHH
jgi:ribose/xylose/arabinose/galactoside ABC-type transport system permease subunit